MIHGGIGYIDRTSLSLPLGLLEPLSIENNTLLFGLYYPSPASTGEYKRVRYPHDLMITPIPPRFWQTIGRIMIRIKHEQGSLAIVSHFLQENGVSILAAECNRSAHRYASWVLTVKFEKLAQRKKLSFDPKNSIYKETLKALQDLESDILNKCTGPLFIDNNDMDLRKPVVPMPACALAFFHNFWQKRKRKNPGKDWLYDPMMLCFDGKKIVAYEGREEKLNSVYDEIDKHKDSLPSIVIAEMDTRDVNIRVVVIPKMSLCRFFNLEMNYQRFAKPDTTRGLFSYLVENLPGCYNMWRVFNQTMENRETDEKGRISCIIEDMTSGDLESQEVINRAKRFCEKFKKLPLPKYLHHIAISKIKVSPIQSEEVLRSIVTEKLGSRISKKDVFVSYAMRDKEIAHKLVDRFRNDSINSFLADEMLRTGDPWNEVIREQIINSREFCLLYTRESAKSQWVSRELGAAWILGKTITPILYGITIKELPDFLKKFQGINFDDIDKYIEDIKFRRTD